MLDHLLVGLFLLIGFISILKKSRFYLTVVPKIAARNLNPILVDLSSKVHFVGQMQKQIRNCHQQHYNQGGKTT